MQPAGTVLVWLRFASLARVLSMLEVVMDLQQQLAEKRAAAEERQRREDEQKFLATRTRMAMQMQQKNARSGVAGNGETRPTLCLCNGAIAPAMA
eukprot:COSAG01_NODE_272_length_19747_cov_298.524023_20_plen_95_part_00